MNALMRWDPFRELEDMSERLNRMFKRPVARSADGKAIPKNSPVTVVRVVGNVYFVRIAE